MPSAATRSVLTGAVVLVLVGVGVAVVANAVDDDLADSAWVLVPLGAIVAASVFAGAVTARLSESAPLARAAAACALAYAVVVVAGVVRWAAGSDDVSWSGVLAGAVAVVAAGVAGARVVSAREGR